MFFVMDVNFNFYKSNLNNLISCHLKIITFNKTIEKHNFYEIINIF